MHVQVVSYLLLILSIFSVVTSASGHRHAVEVSRNELPKCAHLCGLVTTSLDWGPCQDNAAQPIVIDLTDLEELQHSHITGTCEDAFEQELQAEREKARRLQDASERELEGERERARQLQGALEREQKQALGGSTHRNPRILCRTLNLPESSDSADK